MEKLAFLLDTNILSAAIKQPDGPVSQKMTEVGPPAFCTSIVVACELRYGAAKKNAPRLTQKVEFLLQALTVLRMGTDVDRHYAMLRRALESDGQTIGSNDQLIAAHALALDLTLVTHNIGEFSRVPGLHLENWLAPAAES